MVDIEHSGNLVTIGDDVDKNPIPELDAYINDNPAESAPALLLKGVYHSRQGDFDSARLNFEQAAVNYPKQSETLTDRLNPYKVRTWLQKSREGNYILDLYKATMLGAGYLVPTCSWPECILTGAISMRARRRFSTTSAAVAIRLSGITYLLTSNFATA